MCLTSKLAQKVWGILLLMAVSVVAEQGWLAGWLAFDPAKGEEPGTVWRYVKSNRDGSRPARLDLRWVGGTRIEVVKVLPGAPYFTRSYVDLDPVRGHMAHAFQHNWQAHTVESTMSTRVSADGKNLRVALSSGSTVDIPLRGAPLHFYGADFLGIAFLLPHLANPLAPFEVDFVDPLRPGPPVSGQVFFFERARFEPAGEEEVHGKRCRKYRMAGPFFEGFEGALWVDSQNGRMERVESSLRTSPDWENGVRLELVSVEVVDDFAWHESLLELQRQLPTPENDEKSREPK